MRPSAPLLWLGWMVAAAWMPAPAQWATPPLLKPEIEAELPHDTAAFTQGLLWLDGKLYESTGLYGQSSLRELNPENGAVIRRQPVAPQYFAEGLAQFRGELVQLTWKAGVAFRYPMKRWDRPPGRFTYDGEGWGLTTLGQSLWMSNGSDTLYRRDAAFRVTGRLPVTLMGRPLTHLNELEGVSGKILANVWYCDSIFIIDPREGRVLAVVDGTPLVRRSRRKSPDAVLNGIAYNPRTKVFFITGKDWPVLFKVRLPFTF